MALIKCPECRGKISEYAETCPHCGLPYQKVPNPAKKWWKVWLLRIGLGLLAAGIIALVVLLVIRLRPRPALGRLSEAEQMVFDAFVIGIQQRFDDPQTITFEAAGGLILNDQYSDSYPEGQYLVTVKISYQNAAGNTVTENYHLTLQDYTQVRWLLNDIEHKKGDMSKSSVPLLSTDRSINAALINQALQEYWAELAAPADAAA